MRAAGEGKLVSAESGGQEELARTVSKAAGESGRRRQARRKSGRLVRAVVENNGEEQLVRAAGEGNLVVRRSRRDVKDNGYGQLVRAAGEGKLEKERQAGASW